MILSDEPLPERSIIIRGVDAILKLAEELLNFPDEFLRADHRNHDSLVWKRFRIVWTVLIDLLVHRPWYGNRTARTENAGWRREKMREPGVYSTAALVRGLHYSDAEPDRTVR